MNYSDLLDTISKEMDASIPKQSLLRICELLNSNEEKYDWVGFYIMNHSTKELHIGPYVGAETDHTIIPFGKGICGQVAVSGETYIAEDISAEGNYIACSLDVKSEIVLPIYFEENLVAQLDIDSHTLNAFTAEDEGFLQDLCAKIGEVLGAELQFNSYFNGVLN